MGSSGEIIIIISWLSEIANFSSIVLWAKHFVESPIQRANRLYMYFNL